MAAAGGRLDSSGAAEADRDLLSVDDHGHLAPPFRQREHALELLAIPLHVEVLELNLALGVILTGRQRVRSGVFTEDEDHRPILHVCIPCETVHIIGGGGVRWWSTLRRSRCRCWSSRVSRLTRLSCA